MAVKDGAWAEYALLPKRGAPARIRLGIVEVLADGRYWLETVTQAQDGPPVAAKMLVRGSPERLRNLERILIYMGGQAPLELPVEDAKAAEEEKPRRRVPRVERKGAANVRVPAGTFRAQVLQVGATRIFRSDKVPLWGLLRAQDRARRIELIGYGSSGGKSVFPDEREAQGNGSESVK